MSMDEHKPASMNIGKVIEFLQGVKDQEGDIKLRSVTGFWVRQIPRTGERVVICVAGNCQAMDEAAPHRYSTPKVTHIKDEGGRSGRRRWV